MNSLEILTKSLTAEVERLSKNENGNGVTPESNKEYPYSSAIKKGLRKENEVIMMAKIAKEQREKSRKENNVVISGLAECLEKEPSAIQKHDDDLVDSVLSKLGLSRDNVKKQTRLKKRAIRANPSASNSDSANGNVSSTKPSPILLEFNSSDDQVTALKNSYSLRSEKVYVNPDRTLNERILERNLRAERDKKNKALPNEFPNSPGRRFKEKNGKKYYYGIRWGELQLIECH